jgi:hypothetical protein
VHCNGPENEHVLCIVEFVRFVLQLMLLLFANNHDRSLSKLKMDKYELPVQEIKTATEVDLSNKGLGKLDAVVIAVLIKVCKLQNRFVTN